VSQLKRNPLHSSIAKVTSATTFNPKNGSKSTIATILGLLQHFFGVAFDQKSCTDRMWTTLTQKMKIIC
jgi:hypothetical protein